MTADREEWERKLDVPTSPSGIRCDKEEVDHTLHFR